MHHFWDQISGCGFTFKNLYYWVVQQSPINSHFVEVGCAYGQSAAFLIVEIINSNKNIKLDLIDPFFTDEIQLAPKTGDYVCSEFLENLKPVEGKYEFKRKTSVEASNDYDDESLDFVFIDGSHEYKDIVDDLKAWIPKVKIGGILAGHDYTWSDNVFKAVHDVIPSGINGKEYTFHDHWGEGCFFCQKLSKDGVFRRFEFDDLIPLRNKERNISKPLIYKKTA
jgi:SAM-dependent methyltransferase